MYITDVVDSNYDLKWSPFVAAIRDTWHNHVDPPTDGGGGVENGGGAHQGGQQVRVDRNDVGPRLRVHTQHAPVHHAVHCDTVRHKQDSMACKCLLALSPLKLGCFFHPQSLSLPTVT